MALLITLPLPGFALEDPLFLSKDIHHNANLAFVSHAEAEEFGSYLSMTVNYPPMKSLLKQLAERYPKALQSRGEAHITVITPLEYQQVLRHKVTIQEIDRIAYGLSIQTADFSVVCLGKAKAKVDNRVEEAFYVVVESAGLMTIRKNIYMLYIEKGGDPKDFDPLHFYPHITLGFTLRDLHESDGAIKDGNSCYAPLTNQKRKSSSQD